MAILQRKPPPPRWDIYEEHLDEAAFLWSQWERALAAANYTLSEVAVGPEERLLAHLDALVLGGERVAARLLLPALEADEASRVSAAGWVLLQAEHADQMEVVWASMLAADPPRRSALRRAFELSQRADLADRLLPRLRQQGPHMDAIIVDVLNAGEARHLGRVSLPELGADAPVELLGAVLRAIQRAPDPAHRPLIERGLTCQNDETRAAAIEAGTLLRVPSTAPSAARSSPSARRLGDSR